MTGSSVAATSSAMIAATAASIFRLLPRCSFVTRTPYLSDFV